MCYQPLLHGLFLSYLEFYSSPDHDFLTHGQPLGSPTTHSQQQYSLDRLAVQYLSSHALRRMARWRRMVMVVVRRMGNDPTHVVWLIGVGRGLPMMGMCWERFGWCATMLVVLIVTSRCVGGMAPPCKSMLEGHTTICNMVHPLPPSQASTPSHGAYLPCIPHELRIA